MSYLGGLSVLSALDDLATRPTTAFVEPYDPAPKVEMQIKWKIVFWEYLLTNIQANKLYLWQLSIFQEYLFTNIQGNR